MSRSPALDRTLRAGETVDVLLDVFDSQPAGLADLHARELPGGDEHVDGAPGDREHRRCLLGRDEQASSCSAVRLFFSGGRRHRVRSSLLLDSSWTGLRGRAERCGRSPPTVSTSGLSSRMEGRECRERTRPRRRAPSGSHLMSAARPHGRRRMGADGSGRLRAPKPLHAPYCTRSDASALVTGSAERTSNPYHAGSNPAGGAPRILQDQRRRRVASGPAPENSCLVVPVTTVDRDRDLRIRSRGRTSGGSPRVGARSCWGPVRDLVVRCCQRTGYHEA